MQVTEIVMESQKSKRVKGDMLLAVLARLAEGIGEAAELFMVFAEAGYGASPARIAYVMRQNRVEEARAMRASQEERRVTRRYQLLLSVLKRDQLVEERPGKLGRAFIITRKGIKKLAALRERKNNRLPPVAYHAEKSSAITIVTFDVPERERQKRAWLRAVLKHLEFTMVQKSVWMGKARIPRTLLDDIRRLRLAEFVEVFQITKTGSLPHLT